MKRNTTILTLVFLCTCFPGFVFAYHILNSSSGGRFVFIKWKNTPIDFRVDGGTLEGKDGIVVVEDACDEWNRVPTARTLCGSLTVLPMDITAANFDTLPLLNDGIIIFDETGGILSSLGLSANTLGIGITLSNTATGEITDALIILNGSIPSSKTTDLLSTTVHEFGHVWGLAHTAIGGINTANNTPGLDPIDPSAIPTMFPFNNPIDDTFGRTLEDDDIAGISLLYPQN